LIFGLANYFNLYNEISNLKEHEYPINKDIIAEIATKVEDKDLDITAGYGDRYIISRGGLCFCSYYGKLYHKELAKEPLAVIDRIDKTYDIKELPIIICFSGVEHESGNVHDKLRMIYLQRDPNILKYFEKIAKYAWKSRFALMRKNWVLLGNYFKKNTLIMNHIMKDAGFQHGIGLINNILINIIENNPDVYSVKLTGAGGGGSVFALVNPEKINNIFEDWKRDVNKLSNNKNYFKSKFPNIPIEIRNQLKNTKFFRIKINPNGVSKIE
jgi:galactokinase/mevalonate kinase-like predicted kinase